MPNTREKLIELLINSPGLETLFGDEEEFAKNADWLIANGVTVQKWIPVTEMLPELNQPCLCYRKTHRHPEYKLGTYMGATFSDSCAAFRSMSHYGCISATHWMPLPPCPEDAK